MKNNTFVRTIAILLFALPALAQQALSIEDAIRLGLQNNYNIRIARANADIARNNAGNGTAGFLPTLNATGSVALATSDQESSSSSPVAGVGKTDTETLNGQIALSWTVFDGFRMFAANSQFRALANLGEASARAQIEGTVVGILTAYFNLVQQQQLLQVQQQALEVSRQRLEKEKVRREVGGSSSTDLLNAQVSFNSDRSNYINQELAVLTARQNLNLQLAQDPATEITVSDEMIIPDLGMNFDALFELAEQRNSALMAADYSRRAATAGVGTANSAFLPRVNLNASYGYTDRTTKNEVTNQFRPPETNTTSKDGAVSLGLSWNLFNGFRDNITRQNAKIEEKISRLQLENTRIQLNGSLREKYETFRKQMELLALEQENVQAARQNLQLQQERLQLGSVSSLEFRDAQINLIRAETALITARFRARITRLEIDQLTGQLSIE